MSKTQVVGDMSEWSGMLSDLFRQIKDGSKTKAQLQAFLENRDPFTITDIRSEWVEFYRKYCRLAVDFSDVTIPEGIGFDRIVFIPKGLTIKAVVDAWRKKGVTVDIANDMDEQLQGRNVREADRNYAIRLRNVQEADEELKNRSYNQLKVDGINSITLLERMAFGFKYWTESEDGQYLDIVNVNLCAGSQHADGNVPSVDFHSDDRKVYVHWYYPDYAHDHLRSRQAVSN